MDLRIFFAIAYSLLFDYRIHIFTLSVFIFFPFVFYGKREIKRTFAIDASQCLFYDDFSRICTCGFQGRRIRLKIRGSDFDLEKSGVYDYRRYATRARMARLSLIQARMQECRRDLAFGGSQERESCYRDSECIRQVPDQSVDRAAKPYPPG